MSKNPEDQAGRWKEKTAQDAPRTTIGSWGDLQVYLISGARKMKDVTGAFKHQGEISKLEEGVDAAVPVDAQNASTSDLENCGQFSTASTPIIFSWKKREERRTKTA